MSLVDGCVSPLSNICSAAIMIFGVTVIVWNRLSSPYASQRETKKSQTNSYLLDLVSCRDVIITHTQEKHEQVKLQRKIVSDESEIKRLMWAQVRFRSSAILYVYNVNALLVFICLYNDIKS